MKMLLRTRFWFKDGKNHEMVVAIPEAAADKIAVAGLAYVEVYVEGKVSNLPSVKLDKPMFEDFKTGG